MQPINLRTSQLLTWVQPKAFGRYWELRQAEQVVGTLTWAGKLGHDAIQEFADGRWRLRQPGIFKADIRISREGTTDDVAVAKLRWNRQGSITFTDNRTYTWKRTGFFHVKWHLFDQSSQQMLEMAGIAKFFRSEATVQVSPFVNNDPHLPVLIGFLWYMVQIERRHAAAVVTVG